MHTCGSVWFVTSFYLTSGCSWTTSKFGLVVFSSSWETWRLVKFVNFQSPDSWRKLRRYLVASQSTAGNTKDEGEDWRISCNKFMSSLFTCLITKHNFFNIYILNIIFMVRDHMVSTVWVELSPADAGCRVLLGRGSEGVLVLFLFMHFLLVSLRHSVTSNSYSPSNWCKWCGVDNNFLLLLFLIFVCSLIVYHFSDLLCFFLIAHMFSFLGKG